MIPVFFASLLYLKYIIDFFEWLIKEDSHKVKLKYFIGRKFQIISSFYYLEFKKGGVYIP